MVKHGYKNINAVIKTILNDYQLTDKIREQNIIQTWQELVGEKLSNVCQPVSLRKGTLTIKAKDKFWREELAHRQHDLVNLLDKRIERSLVKKINII